ncbi:MAG: DUF3618 domain-containing protein [Verrucomicrobiales bacterium]|nr:DUF3618 domain-containing protein [Verrucomicrobiales bacterium]
MNHIQNNHKRRTHRDPRLIAQEISQARREMDNTLDQISTKFQPSNYVDQARDWCSEKWQDFDLDSTAETAGHYRDKVVGGIKQNPVPVALAGLAVASLFLNRQNRSSKKETTTGETPVSDTHSPDTLSTPSTAKDWEEHLSFNGTDTRAPSHSTSDRKISQAWHEVSDTVSEQAKRTSEKVAEAAKASGGKLRQGRNDSPLLTGAGAIALGFLAALALPRTKAEDELYGETGERLKNELKDQKDAALENAKQHLDEKQLNPEGLKERVEKGMKSVEENTVEKIDDYLNSSS